MAILQFVATASRDIFSRLGLVESSAVVWCQDGSALIVERDRLQHRMLDGRRRDWRVEKFERSWCVVSEDAIANPHAISLAMRPARRMARRDLSEIATRIARRPMQKTSWWFLAAVAFSGWMILSAVRGTSPVAAAAAAASQKPVAAAGAPISIPSLIAAPALSLPSAGPEIELLPECDVMPSDLDAIEQGSGTAQKN